MGLLDKMQPGMGGPSGPSMGQAPPMPPMGGGAPPMGAPPGGPPMGQGQPLQGQGPDPQMIQQAIMQVAQQLKQQHPDVPDQDILMTAQKIVMQKLQGGGGPPPQGGMPPGGAPPMGGGGMPPGGM